MIEKFNRPIPDYYRTMYQDGFEPYEILAAVHKKMLATAANAAEKPAPQTPDDYNVNITSEVKVKK